MRPEERLFALAGVVALGACGSAPPAVPAAPPVVAAAPRAAAPRSWAVLDTAPARVTIFVATTRRSVSSAREGERFGPDDGDSLQFAAVAVNVPSYRARGTGELPRPTMMRSNAMSYAPDPQRDFFVVSVIPADSNRFVQRLAADLAA